MHTTHFSGRLSCMHAPPLCHTSPHHAWPPAMHASAMHTPKPCMPPLPCMPPFTTPPPPVDRRNDTYLWKHYLPATTVLGVNYEKLWHWRYVWTKPQPVPSEGHISRSSAIVPRALIIDEAHTSCMLPHVSQTCQMPKTRHFCSSTVWKLI